MSGRPIRRTQEAPDSMRDDAVEFMIDFDEFTSLNSAFSKEKRCVDVWIE